MYKDFGLLISGKWQSASNQEVISVVSPVTEQLIGTIPAATRDDIERTLVNCQQAGVEWKKTSAWSGCKEKLNDLTKEVKAVVLPSGLT